MKKIVILLLLNFFVGISSASANGEVFKIESYATGIWTELREITGNWAPINRAGGDNQWGPIVAGGWDGRRVAYMNSYSANTWHYLREAPFYVKDIAGNNYKGPIIIGGTNGNRFAYMTSYSANMWIEVADNIPFDAEGIAGDNKYGPIVWNGNQIAYIDNYSAPSWKIARFNAPFDIIDVRGDLNTGIVAFGGPNRDKVAYLSNVKTGAWVTLSSPYNGTSGSAIKFIAGNNVKGPAIVDFNDNVKIMSSYRDQKWVTIGKVPKSNIVDFTGENKNGLIMVSNNNY